MDPSMLTVYKSPYNKLRLGKDYDGGYIIADIPNVKYDLFLAGGIEKDISFEVDFIDRYHDIKSYAYDGTIDKLPEQYNDINANIHLENKIIFIKKT